MTKILVFLHGTVIMHYSAAGRRRAERVQQVREREESVHNYDAYIPVGTVASKLRTWAAQGAVVFFLSSRRTGVEVEQDQVVLRAHNFPEGPILFRKAGETCQDVAGRLVPDILIEDDCESIGGEREMTYPHIRPGALARIKSIVVPEFGSIDHLPDKVVALFAIPTPTAANIGRQ